MIPNPNPALVTIQGAQRLPRLALLLFCAAYVLPGLFARDPWRGADLTAFGQMLAIAEGRAPWLQPMLGGVPTDAAWLPNWVGALAILATQGWLDATLAARLPFAALLALSLVAVWYATYHLASTDAAQPLPLAFGGEASKQDYARAVADGALLALIATLGLLQLGHETTPELAQLAALASWQWALAAAPRRGLGARLALLLALPALAACGAPAMALAVGAGSLLLCWRQQPALEGRVPQPLGPWVIAAMALAGLLAWPTHAWAWRLGDWPQAGPLARLFLWFLWPAWLLAAWTLWRWRRQLTQWHIALPLTSLLVALVSSVGMGGSDRALMLGLPGIAALAAFALPTLQRGTTAAIDWFSVLFFTVCALTIWVLYMAMQTGVPAQPAANVARLAVGFQPRWSVPELLLAAAGTLAWAWLVRWRTGRHREALWKSLVLPAGGVALCWLLLMTLWLPLLDYARSNRPLVERLLRHAPGHDCLAAPNATTTLVAALEWHGSRRVDARASSAQGTCDLLVLTQRGEAPSAELQALMNAGWQAIAHERRPTERQEWTWLLRRPAAVKPSD